MMRRIGYRMCLEGRRCWREYSCAVDVASMLVQGKSLNLRGRNGSGKSKTCDHVVVEEEARGRKVRYLTRLREEVFVKENAHSRVGDVLGGIRNAQDLIVRFGLVNLWYRRVLHLSTGETRKLYLAHAISSNESGSDLIVLDQPYDGLDIHTRNILRHMIEEVSEGLAQMLIGTHSSKSCHGANEETTQHDSNEPTQVLLATNRPEEECMRDVDTVNLDDDHDDPEKTFLSKEELKTLLVDDLNYSSKNTERIVKIDSLSVYSDSEDSDEDTRFKILNDVTWNVMRGETWIINGSNGSGKSSLMRNLLHNHETFSQGNNICLIGPHSIEATDACSIINKDELVCDVLVESVCKLLHIEDRILNRPLNSLSQGEFQMVLFGRALLLRPDILLVDEGFHGLDKWNRSNILHVLDYLSKNRLLTSVIISHHKNEWLPSSTNRLDLHEGRVVRTVVLE